MFTFADINFTLLKFPEAPGITGTLSLDGDTRIVVTMNDCSLGGSNGLWQVTVLPYQKLKCMNDHNVKGFLDFRNLEKTLQEIQQELNLN